MSTPRSPEIALVLALVAGSALSQGLDAQTERDRIARERAGVEAQASAARATCRTRFATAACVESVEAERRERLRALDRQRALLDEAQRKERAMAREARIAERRRQTEAARAAPSPPPEAATKAARQAEPPPGGTRTGPVDRAEARSKAASAAELQAARRTVAAQGRAAEIEAHRAAVERRNAAAKRKPGVALPASAPN